MMPLLNTIEKFSTFHTFHYYQQVIMSSVGIIVSKNVQYTYNILTITNSIMYFYLPMSFFTVAEDL